LGIPKLGVNFFIASAPEPDSVNLQQSMEKKKRGSLRFEFDNKSHFFTSAINRPTTTSTATTTTAVRISLIPINKLESVQINVIQKIVSGIWTTGTNSTKKQQPKKSFKLYLTLSI